MLKLKCEICGSEYKKPKDFKKWNDQKENIFFKWSLKYCDKCRRKKELESLKKLPGIINALFNER